MKVFDLGNDIPVFIRETPYSLRLWRLDVLGGYEVSSSFNLVAKPESSSNWNEKLGRLRELKFLALALFFNM